MAETSSRSHWPMAQREAGVRFRRRSSPGLEDVKKLIWLISAILILIPNVS
jgi:hypothetical protein